MNETHAEGTPLEVPPLKQLYLYLTEGCNLACRHCWLAPGFDPGATKLPVLSVALAQRAVDEALPLGLTGIKLTGGEPLLAPDFEAIVALAGQHELGLSIETNGLLCSPAVARAIAAVAKRDVSVSLDGVDAETHDRIRGVEGAFDKACQGVRALVDADIAPQIIFTIMGDNRHQIEAMARLAEKLGASSLKLNLLQPTARGEAIHARDEAPGVQELLELGQWVDQQLAPSTPLKLLYDWPVAFRPLSRMAEGNIGHCGILSILGVLPTGEYALCGIGKHVPELVFGRIGEDPLERVWRETPILEELRAGLPKQLKGVCARCLMKHRCLGSCLAQGYYRTRSLWQPFWFCEQAEALGCFPETRLIPSDETAE